MQRLLCYLCWFCLIVITESYATINTAISVARPYMQSYLSQHPIWKINLPAIERAALQKIKRTQIGQFDILELRPKKITLPFLYPVRSSLLSVGKVRSRKIKLALPVPIALVGDGAVSKAWLVSYYQRLEQLHVKIFVVNVQNAKDMLEMQQQFPGLSFVPVQANIIAKRLNLKHYPVFISSNFIKQ